MHSSSSSSSRLRLVVPSADVERAIMNDIQSIDDVDDFVGENEEEIIELLCRDYASGE
jgi:hypothetical protein